MTFLSKSNTGRQFFQFATEEFKCRPLICNRARNMNGCVIPPGIHYFHKENDTFHLYGSKDDFAKLSWCLHNIKNELSSDYEITELDSTIHVPHLNYYNIVLQIKKRTWKEIKWIIGTRSILESIRCNGSCSPTETCGCPVGTEVS